MNATNRSERVISRVRAIPPGFVSTYKDIEPGSPRLVGRVLAEHWRTAGTRGRASDVAWHRVVRSDGSAPIGARQLELLRKEGVPVRGYRVDLDRARLSPDRQPPTTLAN
jgi:methylated-DNA-protein-cysteine methyltransferase related protein